MRRWIWLIVCAVLGLMMLVCGLVVPVHLMAVDVNVIQEAGRQTTGLVRRGLELAEEDNLGAAELLWEAAQLERLPGREQLALAITNLAALRPSWMVLGSPNLRLERLLGGVAVPAAGGTDRHGPAASDVPEPFTELVVPRPMRQRGLGFLEISTNIVLQELLRCRDLTNTAIFPPSSSASGQALDTALVVCGALLEEKRLSPALSNRVYELAWTANHGGHAPPGAPASARSWNTEPLEQVLLDLMSLGQRFNWGQLEVFTRAIQDPDALRRLAFLARKSQGQAPVLFAAVVLTGQPGAVGGYALKFSETGMADLAWALRYGAGGVKELLARNQRGYNSLLRQRLAAFGPLGALLDTASEYCLLMPWFALGVKWFLYLGSGFLLALAMHFGRPAVSALEQPLQVRGVHIAREVLFAVGFLLAVLVLSEPFLAQEGQNVEVPFRVRLPLGGRAMPAAVNNLNSTFMSQVNLMTLVLFFALQALVYTACLFKLAEIRRQRVTARMKIKLLENEDHLFDAGLYLGFVGTIVSFILVTMGIVKFSIMAAYSSTSFGIIFVSIFKIFNLRPLRRQYLLEADAGLDASPEGPGAAATPSLATRS